MKYDFFLPMKIPSVTDQEKRIAVRNGKPFIYKDWRLKDAKQKFIAYLAQHRPERPMEGPIMLKTGWFYEPTVGHPAGTYKTTKPDTDNLVKLFKDCMTRCGYWWDDAQVAVELTEKLYGGRPGILVSVCELDGSDDETDHSSVRA